MRTIAAAAVALGLAAPAGAQDYAWQPDQPINIIVPWSAGGSTDQITRVVAPLIEEALGTTIVVVNQPGASGSIGTQTALAAPRDGYTWTANAIANNATYAVTGLIEDTSIDDYRVYLHIANVPVVSVNPDSPYETFDDFLAAMEGGGADLTVATAGINSSGGMALAALREGAGEGADARAIAYDGGNPAVLAAASGEAQATTQLASEQAELIRAGRLRPLVALAPEPLEIEGIDPIPPITDYMEMDVAPDYFGVFIPEGAPQEVYDTMDQVWQDAIMDAEVLQTYARQRGATFDPAYGEAAREKAMPVVISEACARVERGEAVVDPAEIGIDCPAM